jgi:response regulator RpfG family c-di-GMP phosphodiesterase
MPIMDGLEATRRIRQYPGGMDTAIIALTASALNDDRRVVMESGVNDFLSKPCGEEELLQKIQACLNLSYLYEGTEAADAVAIEDLRQGVPAGLVGALQLAIQNGDKGRLDQLIEQIGEQNGPVSDALKDLADRYEYEALTRLLEGAAV